LLLRDDCHWWVIKGIIHRLQIKENSIAFKPSYRFTMLVNPHQYSQFEGFNVTTNLRASQSEDVEADSRRHGNTIRNETIIPHEDSDIEEDDEQQQIPHLRPVDYAFCERALDHFHAITPAYFSTPLPEAFNWDETAERLGKDYEGDWFIVAFRSIRSENADHQQLYNADALAHEEAIQSGGLLKVTITSLSA
jgi:hypothetical protein